MIFKEIRFIKLDLKKLFTFSCAKSYFPELETINHNGGCMSITKKLTGTLAIALFSSVAAFATPTPDAMRGAAAIQLNAQLASSVSLTKDANANIISFHVNGVNPTDAEILIKKDATPLSTEFTVINGITKEGGTCCYMLPSNVATAQVVEAISKELVNAGATSLQITKQLTGKF